MENFTKAQIRDFAKRHGITFVDLRRNYAFHLIFGTQGNEDLLLMLVNAILPDQGITSVKLNPTENAGLREDSRSSVFDISATTSTGTFINIEMQFSDQDDFGDRMVFYLCFPIINDLRTGKLESFKLATKYSIGITNFVLKGIDKNDDVINYYGIRNEVEGRSPLSKSVHYVTVELPKFTKSLQELITPAERMLYTIAHIHEMKEMPAEFVGTGLEKLFEICRFAHMEEFVQMDYVRRLMAEIDERSQQRTAISNAEERGMKKGLKQG